MADLKGFDTNILVYAFNADEKEKHKKALGLLEDVYSGKYRGFLSIQNLNELFYIITRKGIKNAKEGGEIVKGILNSDKWVVRGIGKETTILAINLTEANKRHFWDNLITANLILGGVKELYTEDARGFKSDMVMAVNPL
ncbi:PIN domain-containing protein [Candidatus Woesearchaeota archaeon]|nr:PIN domain-containing protein [Candidatus Woesearchaeota archaeon]